MRIHFAGVLATCLLSIGGSSLLAGDIRYRSEVSYRVSNRDCSGSASMRTPSGAPMQYASVQYSPMHFVPAAPVHFYYPGATYAAPQQGLVEILPWINLVTGLIDRFGGFGGGSGSGGGGNPPADSDSLRKANETLTRIEGKVGRLEELIVNRLNRVEEDVATLQKAQKESGALIDQRLVENKSDLLRISQANADLIKANTEAIIRTQQETAFLISNATATAIRKFKLDGKTAVNSIDGQSIEIDDNTDIDVLFKFKDDSQIVEWTSSGKKVKAFVKKGQLKEK